MFASWSVSDGVQAFVQSTRFNRMVVETIQSCWSKDSMQRPHFAALSDTFHKIALPLRQRTAKLAEPTGRTLPVTIR